MINYLTHNEIDKKRWDQCIDQSLNSLPYAMSWWLDVVSPGWDALVEDDYTAVMPLTRKRKLGITYLCQPFFTQQLGVFSSQTLNFEDTGRFLASIPAAFRYINIQLNAINNPAVHDFHFFPRTNYTVQLNAPYFQLASGYHRNCRRNIQKAIHAGLIIKPGIGPSVFARFVKRNLDKQLATKGNHLFTLMQQMSETTIQKGNGEILGVYSSKRELLAAGWFVTFAGRCLFLACASTAAGKLNQAMYLLVDHVIKEKSGSEMLFDFTGSNIPGIAYFNAGFGAAKSTYLAVKRNLLPWPVRVFKK